MIPLRYYEEQVAGNPPFLVPRLLADVQFEPQTPPPDARTFFAGAYVDSGSPYLIIPYDVHSRGWIKIHGDLGLQPYRLPSMSGPALLQRFVEVGIRFFVAKPAPDYRPADFALVKAYLLEKSIRPTKKVVIGLDAIRTHFPLFANGTCAFFLEPGDRIQLP